MIFSIYKFSYWSCVWAIGPMH